MPDRLARLDVEHGAAVEQLTTLRHEFEGIVAASVDSNGDDEHDPEGSTIAFERSQVGALIEQAELRLAEIESARERVQSGTYGVCERCGNSIPEARLDARPIARTCVECVA